MADFLDALQEALTAAGIRCSVPIVGPFSTDGVEWSAVVSIFDEQFNDDTAVRQAFEGLGTTVEWINHDLYSRFNRTASGTDEGGGKTWNVIFIPGEVDVAATAATGFTAGDMSDAHRDGFAAGQGAQAGPDRLLREVCEELMGVGCEPCVGSHAPMEDLHGRIKQYLSAQLQGVEVRHG